MKIQHLGIITAGYPCPATPASYTFVKQFALAVARSGLKCTVFAPVPLHDYLKNPKGCPYYSREEAGENNYVDVYRPRYISLGARVVYAKFGMLNPSYFTLHQYTNSVLKTMKREGLNPDAFYGHFLYLSGAAAIRIGQQVNKPAFPGLGENTDGAGVLWSTVPFGSEHAKQLVKGATKVVANSALLTNSIHKHFAYPEEKMKVFPNGTNLNFFKPVNKSEARKNLGLPNDAFIVGTIGHFSERKGQARVFDAIKHSKDLKVIFSGQNIPYDLGYQVLWNSPVTQDQMPELLSACDVFVLPTLREGCCNAIIEAMACGLPVISSDCQFNDVLLTDDMSIRVNPMDVDALRKAIELLSDDPELVSEMGKYALDKAQHFNVDERARGIIQFMEDIPV